MVIRATLDPCLVATLGELVPVRLPAPDLALDLPGHVRAASAVARWAGGLVIVQDDVSALVQSGGIYEVSGIGKATGQIVEEIARTGTSKYLDELRAQYPAGNFGLLRVRRRGLLTIGHLHSELGSGSL